MFIRTLAALILSIAAINAGATTTTFMKNVNHADMDRWVDSVYNSMTPHQRIGQLFIAKLVPTQGEKTSQRIAQLVGNDAVGGLLFTEGTIEQYAKYTNQAQALAKTPLLMTLDGEWGLSMRIDNTTRFPQNMGLGAMANPALAREYGREVGRQCRELGIHVNFAPVADVNSNPHNPVIGYRSFGEDPHKVAELVTQYSLGLEDMGVQAVAKHFPGHGDTNSDSHKTLPIINQTRAQLNTTELVPFDQFFKSGCSGLMTGHISIPNIDNTGTPGSLSFPITQIAREMGFEGLIYTDALGMQGANLTDRDNAVEALRAGADCLLCPLNVSKAISTIETAITDGRLSQQLIEQRVKRILQYKYALGLNHKPAPIEIQGLENRLNSWTAQAIDRELAAASMTCLFNKSNLLPIKNLHKNTIAVVQIGAEPDNFVERCKRYANVDVYSSVDGVFTPDQLDQIRKHHIVIAAVYNNRTNNITALSQLSGVKHLIDVFFINPYKMAKFKAQIQKANSLILAYDNTPSTRDFGAQAIFGGIEVTGRMPINLEGICKIGQGVTLPKTRLGYTAPETEGFSPQLQAKIDSICNDAVARNGMPGAQVLVARHGNVVVEACYGKTTPQGPDVTPATIYDLASVSKATGTLPGVMLAVDKGKINIDEKASKYIPGLRNSPKSDITIRQLLFHESGMPPSVNMLKIMTDANGNFRTDIVRPDSTSQFNLRAAHGQWVGQATFDTIMKGIYTIPLRKNQSYTYSCLNFCLLMDAEQRTMHKQHQDIMASNFWKPLGATTTGYRPWLTHSLDQIAPTEVDTIFRHQTVHGTVHDETAAYSGGVQGNAGLFSNADDLAKLCQMLLNGGTYGEHRFLLPKTVANFLTTKSPTCRRGLGFDKPDVENPDNSPTTELANGSTVGHLGFTGTVFWVDPENDLIFIFLTNRVHPTRNSKIFNSLNLRPKLFRAVLESLEN